MKAKILSFLLTVLCLCEFFSFSGVSSGSPEQLENSTPTSLLFKRVVHSCIKIWTHLDLIASIRSSIDNYQHFGDALIDELLDLRTLILALQQERLLKNGENAYIAGFLAQLNERFDDIFQNNAVREIICAQVLLERVIRLQKSV